MAREVIDDRLIGAIHVRSLTLAGLDHDAVEEHRAVQAGTIDALMAGSYEGDASLAEVLRLGDTGIGTTQQLGGEMVVLDGVPWLIDGDGVVTELDLSTKTPFAVVCPFRPAIRSEIPEGVDLAGLMVHLDQVAPVGSPILALRIHGSFPTLALRSVHRQHPPYPPLSEVVHHQSTFEIDDVVGTVVGFRFDDAASGIEVPGYHLHFLADDRRSGGHVTGLTVEHAIAEIDHCDSLHVELPPGVEIGTLRASNRSAIDLVEGRGTSAPG